jgi:allantoate deiminase
MGGIEPLQLRSGAGHDAVTLSAIMPVAMLFVRCKGGISHNPSESISDSDVAVTCQVLDNLLDDLARAYA